MLPAKRSWELKSIARSSDARKDLCTIDEANDAFMTLPVLPAAYVPCGPTQWIEDKQWRDLQPHSPPRVSHRMARKQVTDSHQRRGNSATIRW